MSSPSRREAASGWLTGRVESFRSSNVAKPFALRDFRLLWFGAFFSFIGSWIQTVAQGWLLYQMTGDKAVLGLVVFCNQIPVALIGPFAGAFADVLNRRKVLSLCQVVFMLGSFYLAAAIYWHFLHYSH